MRVEVNVLESGTEPRASVLHQSALMMALRTSIEVGSRRSEIASHARRPRIRVPSLLHAVLAQNEFAVHFMAKEVPRISLE